MFGEKPLYLQAGGITRQISAENQTGEKNGGCRVEPNPEIPRFKHSAAAQRLGRGWKVNPFVPLPAGETLEIANIEGSGCINQMFLTSDLPCFSSLVLRIYWDGEENPSVECPAGAFYAMGHDFTPCVVSSAMVTVAPHRGMSCYWQMPFRKSARITLTNENGIDANIIAYRVLYKLYDIPKEAAYFHAQYRRSLSTLKYPEHAIADGITGKGLYVGTYLACNVLTSGWWGEGEVKFYIDDDEFPSIADNGTEDYFGGAWNFGSNGAQFTDQPTQKEQSFCSPYLGLPLVKTENPNGPRKYGMYRWHILDSIGFEKNLKVTVQTLGWFPGFKLYRPIPMDIASVAYWYQEEPHRKFPELPSVENRCDM
jgi:hypothetical protein